MAKVRRIDWSPSEWLSGTRGIGMDETAVYITVLNIIYDRGGVCPNDASFIAGQLHRDGGHHRQARAAVTVRTAASLVRLIELGKLHVNGQGLVNDRAQVELSKASERIVGAARAGAASGKARHDGPMTPQRLPNDYPRGSDLSNSNDLTRTPVRIINHHYESSSSSIFTDAARDPAQVGGSGPRASRRETMKERMAALAALNRRKFLA